MRSSAAWASRWPQRACPRPTRIERHSDYKKRKYGRKASLFVRILLLLSFSARGSYSKHSSRRASDEEALGVLLNRIYDKDTVFVQIMHKDITAEYGNSSANIVAAIFGFEKVEYFEAPDSANDAPQVDFS